MSLSSSLVWVGKYALHQSGKALGLLPQERPRTYEMYYEVSLKNDSAFSQSCTLILPEPMSRERQELLSPVTPAATVHHNESRFGNKYIAWNLDLGPQEEKGVETRVTAEIKPIDTRSLRHSSQTVHDYANQEAYTLYATPSSHLSLTEEVRRHLLRSLKPDTTPVSTLLEQIQEIVCKTLVYGNPIPGLYRADEAVKMQTVDCGGFSTLFVALCQSCGIPARIVSGFWTVPTKHAMHAWVEALHPSGTWIPIDPSVYWLRSQKRSWRSGEIGFVGSDHMIFSVGCDFSLEHEGKKIEVDILQTPVLLQAGTDIKMNYTFTSQRV
jgi:hypothetical protein